MITQMKWCQPIVRKPQSIEAGIPGELPFRFTCLKRNKNTGRFRGGVSGVGIYQSLGRDQRGNWQHNQTRNIMTPAPYTLTSVENCWMIFLKANRTYIVYTAYRKELQRYADY
jgi:hypothetical protein